MSHSILRILCFGDSLTSGFCHHGLTEHPYSDRLKELITSAFPHRQVHIFTNGEPGDIASNQPWERRLAEELKKRPYDWVIVLGGTNDIGNALTGEQTMKGLERTWRSILFKGSQLLALTIPECHVKIPWLDEARDHVNEKILNYKARNFHVFDLNKALPYYSLSPNDREEYWDDGLHLSPSGYDWMGSLVAKALIPLLKEEEAAAAAYEEESGSGRANISQGYVIVRKKDLD